MTDALADAYPSRVIRHLSSWPTSDRIPVEKAGTPKASAQRNFAAADSRIMRDKGAFVQAYKGLLSVDGEHQIIVAAKLSNLAPDVGYLIHLLDLVPSNCEQTPKAALVDAGYFVDANVRRAHAAEGCNNELRPPPRRR